MDRKTVLVAVAAVLFAIGLISGLTTISAGQADCGSVLRGGGDSESALGRPNADCDSKVGDRKPITYGALGLAAITLVVAIAIKEDDHG